jgi:predicted nucleotidyltransferase
LRAAATARCSTGHARARTQRGFVRAARAVANVRLCYRLSVVASAHADIVEPEPLPRAALELVLATWRPDEIWIYGSRAKGIARPDSDWDLLVVVPDETAPDLLDLVEAWRVTSALRPPVEVYPVRRTDFDEGRRWVGSLANIAVTEGRRVYGR